MSDVPFATLAYTRSLGGSKGGACEVLVNGVAVAQLAIKGVEVTDEFGSWPMCRFTLPLEHVDVQTIAPGPRL